MKTKITLDAVYAASSDVVVRQIEDEIILFPFASGEDDTENEPCFLNTIGQTIWQRLDGTKSIKDIIVDLVAEFKAPVTVIEKDIMEFVEKLIKRRLLVKVSGA